MSFKLYRKKELQRKTTIILVFIFTDVITFTGVLKNIVTSLNIFLSLNFPSGNSINASIEAPLSMLHDFSPVFHIFYLFLFSILSYLLSSLPVYQFSYHLLVSSLLHLLVCHCFLIPWFVFLISKIF